MKRGNVEKWPVYFISSGNHIWENIVSSKRSEDDDDSNRSKFSGVKCKSCSLIAMQDTGSLAYFVVEADSEFAFLSCEEIQIKKIIE